MKEAEILKKYESTFLDEPFIKKNLTYAFGNEQIQEAIKNLGATSEDDLTSIFGVGDVCLISKAHEIISIINKFDNEKENWLKNLTEEEKEIITKYEIKKHSNKINPVLKRLEKSFGKEFIFKVWNMYKK